MHSDIYARPAGRAQAQEEKRFNAEVAEDRQTMRRFFPLRTPRILRILCVEAFKSFIESIAACRM
jgi:hypothetical protein